jgi:hypothetical protein
MASGLLIFPGAQPSRSRSGGIVAAELRWYVNETTTPAIVYTDEALTIPHPFPIVSDDAGRFALIWADTADFFSVNWTTAAPDSQSQSYDNLSASTAVDVQLLDTMNNLLDQAEDIYDQVISANTGFSSVSTTELTIGTGPKALVIQTAKSFLTGTPITLASNSTPSAFMFGEVTTYDITNGDFVVNITVVGGAGSYDDWNVTLAGPRGPAGELSSADKASAADIRAKTNDLRYTTAKGLSDAVANVTATVSGSYTPDFSLGLNFEWTLNGALMLNTPTNLVNGTNGLIWFIQDGTGSRTLTLASGVGKIGGTPTLSTAAGSIDIVPYAVRGGVLYLWPVSRSSIT